jgi:hypothetical protein
LRVNIVDTLFFKTSQTSKISHQVERKDTSSAKCLEVSNSSKPKICSSSPVKKSMQPPTSTAVFSARPELDRGFNIALPSPSQLQLSATTPKGISSPFTLSTLSPFAMVCSPVFSPLLSTAAPGTLPPELAFPAPPCQANTNVKAAATAGPSWDPVLDKLPSIDCSALMDCQRDEIAEFEYDTNGLFEITASEVARAVCGPAVVDVVDVPTVPRPKASKRTCQKPKTKKAPQPKKVTDTEFLGLRADGTPRRRRAKKPVPEHVKQTDAYRRRRARNTEAARKNRERKRQEREAQKHQVSAVEQENCELRALATKLRDSVKELQQLVVDRVESSYPEGVPAHMKEALSSLVQL